LGDDYSAPSRADQRLPYTGTINVEWLWSTIGGWLEEWGNLPLAEKIWISVGAAGQVVFGMRFIVQWIATERHRRTVVPVAFWYMSFIGSVIVLTYVIHRRDPVLIPSFSLNLLIYLRNLYFIHRKTPFQAPAAGDAGDTGPPRKTVD